MELNSQINTFNKGMNMDVDIAMLPEGQYRYAENIRLLTDADGTTGLLQNIEYIRRYNQDETDNIPLDEEILGTTVTRWFNVETGVDEECGIVLTKTTDNINNIYRVSGFDSTTISSKKIISGKFEILNKVSIISNYESDKASNVYISDGLSSIKVINL